MACPYPVSAHLVWLGDNAAARGRNPDMVNEYTPDEFNVLMAWVTTGIGPEDNLKSEFDRWLEQERADARREGWEACALAIQDGLGVWDAFEHYGRSETEEDRHVDQ